MAEVELLQSLQVYLLVELATGVLEVVLLATGVFDGSQSDQVVELVLVDPSGFLELEEVQALQVVGSALLDATGVFEVVDQTAQLVASGVGTQTGEPVSTYVASLHCSIGTA